MDRRTSVNIGPDPIRLEALAQPKHVNPLFIEWLPRETVYWVDKLPSSTVNRECSERVRLLAKSRKPHPDFVPNRLDIPDVSPAAMRARTSERIRRLARPRSCVPDFQPDKSSTDIGKVKPAALKFRTTERLNLLSTRSPFQERLNLRQDIEKERQLALERAMSHKTTRRERRLAKPKKLSRGYKKHPPWTSAPYAVSSAALTGKIPSLNSRLLGKTSANKDEVF